MGACGCMVIDTVIDWFWRSTHVVLALFAVGALCDDRAIAAEPITIPLWEEGAPGFPATKPSDEPVLFVSAPAGKQLAVPTAVVVLPGGGYGHLAMDHEGRQIADWFNSFGVTTFVLKYRMKATGHRHPVPMLDGQRAIRLVRARAKEFHVDPARIGVMGFSAGGHLASTLGTHFDEGQPEAVDPIDHAGCRPDFMILCYPVISFEAEYAHNNSAKNLLGNSPEKSLLANLSNETQVTGKTPPTFLFQTTEDKTVPAENAVSFYLALRKAGVSAELHVFQRGRHGLGLAENEPATSAWPGLCQQWLDQRGLLSPP